MVFPKDLEPKITAVEPPPQAAGLSDPSQEYQDGQMVVLNIDGQPTWCIFRDFTGFDFSAENPEVKLMVKKPPVPVRFTTELETFQPKQDGATPYTVGVGVPVIMNLGEDPYPFSNVNETPTQAVERFNETYGQVEGPGLYEKLEPFKVISVNADTAIRPSYDPSGLMGTRAGGVVTERGYTITASSIGPGKTYEFAAERVL